MANFRTDLDKLVGTEPEDIVDPKGALKSFKARAPEMAMDDKLPVKQLPMADKGAPFKLTGGGKGG